MVVCASEVVHRRVSTDGRRTARDLERQRPGDSGSSPPQSMRRPRRVCPADSLFLPLLPSSRDRTTPTAPHTLSCIRRCVHAFTRQYYAPPEIHPSPRPRSSAFLTRVPPLPPPLTDGRLQALLHPSSSLPSTLLHPRCPSPGQLQASTVDAQRTSFGSSLVRHISEQGSRGRLEPVRYGHEGWREGDEVGESTRACDGGGG